MTRVLHCLSSRQRLQASLNGAVADQNSGFAGVAIGRRRSINAPTLRILARPGLSSGAMFLAKATTPLLVARTTSRFETARHVDGVPFSAFSTQVLHG